MTRPWVSVVEIMLEGSISKINNKENKLKVHIGINQNRQCVLGTQMRICRKSNLQTPHFGKNL